MHKRRQKPNEMPKGEQKKKYNLSTERNQEQEVVVKKTETEYFWSQINKLGLKGCHLSHPQLIRKMFLDYIEVSYSLSKDPSITGSK